MQGHLRSCAEWRKVKNDILASVTKEFLEKEHVERGKSVDEIVKDLGLKNLRGIISKLDEFNIPYLKYNNNQKHKERRIELAKKTSKERYGFESHLTKGCSVREKVDKTVMEKYGVKNVYASEEVKKKIKKTNLKKYGFENPSSSPLIKEKVLRTCVERYNVTNVRKSPEIINKIKRIRAQNLKYIPYSKQSQLLFNFLYGCLYKTNLVDKIYYATLNKEFGRKLGDRYYYYDFVISSIGFCIEYNGSYWHADPRTYKREDPLYGGLKAGEIWEKDKIKIGAINDFEIWVIWEDDFIGATDFYSSQILGRINELYNGKPRCGLFESDITRDSRKWNLNRDKVLCKIF